MKLTIRNLINRILVVALIMAPFQSGQASMISIDQVSTTLSAQADRNTVVNLLSRAETINEFQSVGLDAKSTIDRVAAMTDEEVRTLAGKINAVPVGGDGLIALILVVFFIWYFAFRR
ncbi:MAG: PA2779 family protein [Sterolibacterium sp.]|nr:PA2779 family protein [Sterolibacterium sp.]